MDKGWIKVNRQITEHWIWQNHEYAFAWIDLLLLVNHENRKVLVNNEVMTIRRGQTLTSIYKLAKKWGWTRKKTYAFIKALEQDGMIKRNSTTKYTIITIVNYGKFQDVGTTKGNSKDTSKDTSEDTTKELQGVHKQEYIKNDKEEKNIKAPAEQKDPIEEELDYLYDLLDKLPLDSEERKQASRRIGELETDE